MKKISIVGDIMCEPLMLKAARKGEAYDFSGVFSNVKPLLGKSDYVIGNLETPLAGKQAKYVHELFSFNAPDEFGQAVKDGGIDLVTTANNHCLDRGVDGLKRTAEVLNRLNIPFTGTYGCKEDRQEAVYFNLNDLRVAVISYTLSTNFSLNHIKITKEEENLINLLRPQEMLNSLPKELSLSKKIVSYALKPFKPDHRCYIKKALHMTYNRASTDDYLDEERIRPYIDKLTTDIRLASQQADLVLFYPHTGGQFNDFPGRFTEYVIEKAIKSGCDIVIGSHPHVVQKAEIINGKPCFYSIGNFSMSPNSVYLYFKNLPQYGIIVHLYIDNKSISDITFSIVKMIEKKKSLLTVYPIHTLYELCNDEEKRAIVNNVEQIYKVVTGKQLTGKIIRREYYTFNFSH